MTTQAFFDLIAKHPKKEFFFEYEAGEFVNIAYHITEIKNMTIESVDCGGNPDTYHQTAIQLWWNGTEKKEKAMTGEKVAKILNIVDKVKPIKRDTELFIEWGFGDLRTSNYQINEVDEQEDKIILKMYVKAPVCKPLEMIPIGEFIGGGCTPGGGCC